MAALDFPDNPTNGQTYGGYYWDATTGGWRSDPVPMGGLPAGSIIQWAGATAPANWFIADGSAVSRTANASLFAVIGTTYGSGDGSTTFNLPDLRGRVAVGKNGGTFGTLGATGGAEAVTLASNNLPQAAVIDANTAGSDTSFALKFTQAAGYGAKTLTQLGTATTAVNNLQPYLVTNYIIKATSGWSAGDSELATRVGALEAAPAGLVRIVPTSVAVGSGSASVSSTGLITFSGVSSISLNNIFSSSFQHYRLTISATLAAGAQLAYIRMRSGTTDDLSTYVWGYTGARVTGGANQWTSGSGSNLGGFGIYNSGASGPQTLSADIMNPAVSGACTTWNLNGYQADSTGAVSLVGSGLHANAASFNGLTYLPGGSTLSGQMQVYGYRN